ncbi:DUF3304 domain-containing protein [Burkholderia multivorans]|uniref:DUF3304 domain-containing protein n=1 Tax=Burkholderia multivorans TaxID=87883 RepID=UPI001C24CDD5|nr:DUF3304 domain-containing protein [Burkholderia multivorans]MBU9135874.1 DUF3304 domain-containing protein [Burkholderia multivorans]
MKANRLSGLVVVLLALLTGCTNLPADESPEIQKPKRVESSSGGTRTLNYTPWYIHTFSISGPKGSGIGGGGPNVMPMRDGGRPSGGGAETCCTSYPREWQPDLRLTVRWKADKKMDGKTVGYWYKADNVRIPQYDGSRSGGVWAIFLPGDRVKLMVADGNANGRNSVMARPTDDDPYVVKGMLDDEWNRLYR